MELLTQTQKQVVHSSLHRIVVEAQPGSGKTKILVERCVNALKMGNCQANQLVAITFTEKAAREIKERISHSLPMSSLIDSFWISTIHGFCHRILKMHILHVDLPLNFSVLSSEQALFLQKKTVQMQMKEMIKSQDLGEKALLLEYGYSKLESLLYYLLSHREILRKASDKRSDTLLEYLKTVFQKLKICYQEEKKRKNSCDFEDLLEQCLKLFKEHKGILSEFRKQFKMILVDEFQDTNDLQNDILYLLTTQNSSGPVPQLMVVGDPKQAIYRFRGADVELFFDIKKDIIQKEGFCFELLENFRSHPHLIDFVNTLFEPLLGEQFLASKPGGKSAHQDFGIEYWCLKEGPEDLFSEERRRREAVFLAAHVKDRSKKVNWSQIAILFRAMTFSSIYEKALDEKEIPWVRRDWGYLYESAEVKGLSSLLKWGLDPLDNFSFWNFISSGIWEPASPQILFQLALERSKTNSSFKDVLKQRFDTLSKKDQKALKELTCLLENMQKKSERISLEEWFRIFPLSPSDTIKRFLNIVREFEVQNKEAEWIDFLEYMEILQAAHITASHSSFASSAKDSQEKQGVQILTVHQAKGLEFEAVYLPDLGYLARADLPWILVDKKLGIGLKRPQPGSPSWKEDEIYTKIKNQERQKEMEESKRLFYVAVTRAKNYLTLSKCKSSAPISSWAGFVENHKERLTPYIKEGVF